MNSNHKNWTIQSLDNKSKKESEGHETQSFRRTPILACLVIQFAHSLAAREIAFHVTRSTRFAVVDIFTRSALSRQYGAYPLI